MNFTISFAAICDHCFLSFHWCTSVFHVIALEIFDNWILSNFILLRLNNHSPSAPPHILRGPGTYYFSDPSLYSPVYQYHFAAERTQTGCSVWGVASQVSSRVHFHLPASCALANAAVHVSTLDSCWVYFLPASSSLFHGLMLSQVQNLHLSMLNFTRSLLASSCSLLWSLWMAVLTSSVWIGLLHSMSSMNLMKVHSVLLSRFRSLMKILNSIEPVVTNFQLDFEQLFFEPDIAATF